MHTAKFGPGGASADSPPVIAPAASHSPTSMTVSKEEEEKLQKMSIGDELNVRRQAEAENAGTRMAWKRGSRREGVATPPPPQSHSVCVRVCGNGWATEGAGVWWQPSESTWFFSHFYDEKGHMGV